MVIVVMVCGGRVGNAHCVCAPDFSNTIIHIKQIMR